MAQSALFILNTLIINKVIFDKGEAKLLIYNHMKICKNRNCNVEIINKRQDAAYCSRRCKNYEKTYRKRDELRIKKLYDISNI
jgi:hypothetical protein